MVAKPTYILIRKGPYTDNSGIHIGIEGEFHKIKLDKTGEIVFLKKEDFIQKRIPKYIMIIKGQYKGYKGYYTGMRAGKLAITLDSTGKTITEFRENIIPDPDRGDEYTHSGTSIILDESKSLRKSDTVSANYANGYEFHSNFLELPETPFTFIFSELLETLNINYPYQSIIGHIKIINEFYEKNSDIIRTKEQKKTLCIAYVFILLNNQNTNIPFNTRINIEFVRPNDDPSYILYASDKLGYIKSIQYDLFDSILQKLLVHLKTTIIPFKSFERYKTPENKIKRIDKPIRASVSPMRFLMKNSLDSKGKKIQRISVFNVKEKRSKIKNKINKIISKNDISPSKREYLKDYMENMDNPRYILELKNNPYDKKGRFLLKYNDVVNELLSIEKDIHYNKFNYKKQKFDPTNPVVSIIYEKEKKRLYDGLEKFKNDNDSLFVLNKLIEGFEKITVMSDYKKRKLRVKMKIQTGKEALLSEAKIALSDKITALVTYNTINNLNMKNLPMKKRVSEQIPMFMKLSSLKKNYLEKSLERKKSRSVRHDVR
jgi:hypothetical protein